jgi:hypothetical protein
MNKNPNRIMWEFLGATALAVTMGSANAQTMRKIGDDSTITATGSEQKNNGDGNVSFTINANKYMNPFRWPGFLSSRYTAVVFSGEVRDDRECPYYSSVGRPRTLKNLGGLTYKVETQATAEEIDHIKKTGCLITESPTLKELGVESQSPSSLSQPVP